jgi:hypothetical protein
VIWTHNRSLAGQQGISIPVSLLSVLLAGLFSHLSTVEVIFKLVKQIQSWGDERIKKIVAALAVEGIKICIATDTWYSYSGVCMRILFTIYRFRIM